MDNIYSAIVYKLQGIATRKPLHPDNSLHPDDDDTCSVTSSYPFTDFHKFYSPFFQFAVHKDMLRSKY